MMRYKESPDPAPPGTVPDGWGDKVMHVSAMVGKTTLMAFNGCSERPGIAGFPLSLSVTSQAEAERAFNALAEGGQVRMPLTKTFWSPCTGRLKDKFGLGWMISMPHQQSVRANQVVVSTPSPA